MALVGASLGGYLALATALDGRVRATSIIALAGCACLKPEERAARRALAKEARAGVDHSELLIELGYAPDARARFPAAIERARGWIPSIPSSAWADWLEAIADSEDLLPRLPRLATPALVMAGSADRSLPPAHSEEIARALPNARLLVIPEVGHMRWTS